MVKWNDHHENNQQMIKKIMQPQVYSQPKNIPGWDKMEPDIKLRIRKHWRDQNRVNQFVITGLVDDIIYLRSLDGRKEILSAYGYQAIKSLGDGKDGKTFFAHPYLDQHKTYVVKTLSTYAKTYIILQLMLQQICQSPNKPNALQTFKLDDKQMNHMWYTANAPFNKITKNDNSWYDALSEVCRLNSWLCKNHGLLFWDFGFNNGKNYMLDNDQKMMWVDYGGAGVVRTERYDTTIEPKGDRWNTEKLNLKNTLDNKQCLVDAYDNFLKIAFFLHLQFWADTHNEEKTNISVWMSVAQINKSVTDEIFYQNLSNKLTSVWIVEMYELFKNHDFTDWVTWKTMGKYINSHVKNT